MPNIKKDIDIGKLEKYINQGLSLKEIANVLNVGFTCVRNRCIEYNLKTKSMKNKERNLNGKTFGRLTVIRHNGRNKNGREQCLCQCNCKNKTIINIQTSSLLNENTKSCGCIASEIIIKRNIENTREFNEEQIESITQCYIDGNDIKFIENKFKISEYLIKNILHNKNISLREKVIPFNENYFKIIDTEDKAYWLGFLYADGYVDDISVELSLQTKDKSHIEKLLKNIDAIPELIIKDKLINLNNKEYKSNRILLNSKIFANDLINKGCIQNKSLKILFPNEEIVPLYLQNHFIRGYFDGDGCISVSNNQWSFSVISNINFIQNMQKILVEQCKLNYTKLINHHSSKKVKYLTYGGSHNIFKIYKYLYKNSKTFLERKYNKFQTFLKFYEVKYNILGD